MIGNPTVVFPEAGKVVIEDREMPAPTPGEVLIRTHKTLISTGTELTMLSGNFPKGSYWDNYVRYPVLPGYCNIGTVVDTGPEVDPKWMGQRVVTMGSHARYVTIEAAQCRPVRTEVSDEQATFCVIAEIVMQGVRRSQVRWGESVVINGLGLLGQFAVRLCQIAGAKPVFGVDVSPDRLGRLPKSAGVIAVNARDASPAEVVAKHTRERMADVVFEVTGDQSLISSEFQTLRNQGRFVILSSPRGESLFDFHDLCGAPSYTIIGSHNFSHPTHATLDYPWTNLRDAELFFDYVADGVLELESLITHRENYGDACDVYRRLTEDRCPALGVILDWEPAA